MTDDQMQRTDIPQDKNRTMREAFTMTDYKNNARNHLKVNLHLTETCNYRCRYCFAHFENGSDLPLEGGISSIAAHLPIPSSEICWRNRLRMSFAGIS